MVAGDVMQQYFVQGKLNIDERFVFNKEQAHHIKNVLRMKQGSQVRVVDTCEQPYLTAIEFADDQVAGLVLEVLPLNASRVKTTLIMGLIKGDKWDYLLQKACECGAYEIQPMISSRSSSCG